VRQIGPVASVISSLEMNPFRLRFSGTSGSGKSLVARNFYAKASAESNQVLTEGQLAFDSIYRYQGQESPAVILVDVDPRAERRERAERLLYCGMTRASVRLDLVVRAGNPENRRFLEA